MGRSILYHFRKLTLEEQIDVAKDELVSTAELHDYNFSHPLVLKASRKLDELIVQAMQTTAKENAR